MKVFIFFLLIAPFSFGQIGFGEIHGTLISDDDELIPFIRVLVYSTDEEGVIKGGAESDLDGRFRLSVLPEGTYNLVLTSYYDEFDTLRIANVQVERDRITFLGEIEMKTNYSWTDARIPECGQLIRIGFEDPFGRSITIKEEDIRRH